MSPASVVISSSGNAALRVASVLADREAGWRLVHHLARFIDSARVPGIDGVFVDHPDLGVAFFRS
mgnify:CR=1 FL=1